MNWTIAAGNVLTVSVIALLTDVCDALVKIITVPHLRFPVVK